MDTESNGTLGVSPPTSYGASVAGADSAPVAAGLAAFSSFRRFFSAFLAAQFGLAFLLTPAYTAGAIAEEKDRGRVDFLLATDLANREIVLSKLIARSVNLVWLILAGLPAPAAAQMRQTDEEFAKAKPGVGDALPELIVYDPDGKEVKTAALRDHYTVLTFGCLT